MRREILFIFLVFSGALLSAQDVEVRAWIDSSRIYIGDQVYYNIQVEQPSSLQLSLKREQDTLLDLIKILETTGPDTTYLEGDRIIVGSRYLITSFDSGSYDIPPFYAEVDSSGIITRFFSDYTHLDVMRTTIIPSDTTDVIFDIIAPFRERITAAELAPWILLGLFVTVAAVFLVRRLKARRSQGVDDDQERLPGEPVHIIILRELDKLERQALWQQGEIKEFYSRLTEILRRFIELKYSITSLEMTTGETLDALARIGIEMNENYDRLKEILTTADLSKFAKYAPGAKVNEGMIDLARKYVRTACITQETLETVEEAASPGGKEVDHA